ncbi:MAG: VCBS repeat-containing protein [Flavobacteriaceae bacterium]
MKKSFPSRHWVCSMIFILVVLACADKKGADISESNTPSDPLFSLLEPEATNIHFQNTLTEGLNANVLMYEYLYNGGGVAAGDFNGDDLIDLYFTSNMGDNAFYLNQGALKFKETSEISKVKGRPGPWKTGITAADVNGDGKLDLYLCYSGALPPEKRKNQLFINLGNDENNVPIFEESAEQYGLASPAFSNQAHFFDYDRDGDLDALLLNHNPKSLPVLNEVSTIELLKKDDPLQGVRLLEQSDGKFNDVTVQSGISGSPLTYGLGLCISDLNDDGWVDFYVSNDYTVPDYLYINNQDGTFTDELQNSLGHTSHFSMGNNIADINNDGLQDILTLDMLPEDNERQKLLLSPDNYEKFDLNLRSGFHYQYMRNMLQLNNGNGTFSEIGQLAGISNTDWSWSALLADYDNDGWKDLYVTNGYFRDYTNLDFINYMEDYVQSKGRLKRKDVLEIIEKMPSTDLTNYLFMNQGGVDFTNKTAEYGLDHPSNSNGAAYADLDNDGDLDLIVNNINKPVFIYRNDAENSEKNYLQIKLQGAGANTQGLGAKVSIYKDKNIQTQEQITTRGYLSTVSPILHFGLGTETAVDSLIVRWNSGKIQKFAQLDAGQLLVLNEKEAKNYNPISNLSSTLLQEVKSPIDHASEVISVNDFKRQSLLINQFSHTGPTFAKGDLNQDGLEDVFVGGGKGQAAALYLQQTNGNFKEVNRAIFEEDQLSTDIAASIFDANADGYNDILVVSGGYHDLSPKDPLLNNRIYFGDGAGNFVKDENALPALYTSSSTLAVGDVNNDSFPDIFIGSRVVPGRYPETPTSHLLINDGSGSFTNQISEIAADLEHLGMITDASWTDMNNDGLEDLVVVGEWLPISIFINNKGKLVNESDRYFKSSKTGWWNRLKIDDFNNDGKPDFIVGNMGLNTQFTVSEAEPAELYYADFDENGSVDPIFCYYIQGESYPYLTRDELLGQLAELRSRFTSYGSYAKATITDILSENDLKSASKLVADHMETTLFLSTAEGKFEMRSLPVQTQYSPVYEIAVSDFNLDGEKDLILFGNNKYFKLRLGKFDANYGTLLLGDGKGDFEYVDQLKSGLNVKGEVRSVVQLNEMLLLGINEEKIKAYKISESN